MSPSFRCPSCQFAFRVDERFLGRTVACPREGCGTKLKLPPGKMQTAQRSVADSGENSDAVLAKSGGASTKRAAKSGTHRVRQDSGVGDVEGSSESGKRAKSGNSCGRSVAGSVAPAITASRRRNRGRVTAATSFNWKPLAAGFFTVTIIGILGLFALWYEEFGSTPDSSGPATTVAGSEEDLNQSSGIEASGDSEQRQTDGNRAAAIRNMNHGSAVQLTAVPSPRDLQMEAEKQAWITEKAQPFFARYCVDCHGPDEQSAGVAVHDLTRPDQLLLERKKWERVYRMVNAGAMPPSSHDPFPPEEEQQQIAEFLYNELFNFDCSLIDHPGRPTIQRLNRAEYNNTVQDLFGIDLTPADKFPQDDVGEGFDNIGDVLSLPPLLMEKYLDAAEEVASAVVDLRDFSKPQSQVFRAGQLVSSLQTSPDDRGFVMLHTNGQVSVNVQIPADGRYLIRVENAAQHAGEDKPRMAVQANGATLFEYEIDKGRRPEWHEKTVDLKQGAQTIAAVFLNDFYDPEAAEDRRDRNAMVRSIEIIGPEGGTVSQWHEIHRRFVTARPGDTGDTLSAARTVLRPILYRAFRRPVSDAEVDRYAGLVDRQVTEFQESYDYGIWVALQAILVAPDFIFRLERDPDGDDSERTLDEYEVASRLSYFLWSSMPDDELLSLAENRRLLDPAMLRQQVGRMLRDERSAALGVNFASQWLNLRNLRDMRPNPDVFPDFDDALRDAMMKETEIFFNAVVREDRAVDDFLLSDFTFVNERLARHYGLDGVKGDKFVRVSLNGLNRAGVLTHASILTLTSNPGRTSPVKRGKWILENILGQAPPPAPPAVPELEETAKASPGLSLREQLALHREDPGCASCHKTMDPLGLGLENFDAIGQWRDKDGEKPIDASGELPSGETFNGSLQLIGIFNARREQFHRALAERMMTYALGRGLEYYDKCAVDKTLENMKQRGYRFSSMVEGIVLSDPFLKRSRTREAAMTVSR